jgi:hypothetical protein
MEASSPAFDTIGVGATVATLTAALGLVTLAFGFVATGLAFACGFVVVAILVVF